MKVVTSQAFRLRHELNATIKKLSKSQTVDDGAYIFTFHADDEYFYLDIASMTDQDTCETIALPNDEYEELISQLNDELAFYEVDLDDKDKFSDIMETQEVYELAKLLPDQSELIAWKVDQV